MFAWGCTIRIIPSDPTFVPSMPVQQKVRQLVRVLVPLAVAIDSEVFGGPVYIGCHYATWGGVCCPLCAADLHGFVAAYFNVPRSVWERLMDASSKGQFWHENIKDVYRWAPAS